MINIMDVARLQEEYKSLVKGKKLSKKAICNLCVPFRDKAGITDSQTLRIARNEMSLMEIVTVCGLDKLYDAAAAKEFSEATSELNHFRNCHYSDSSATKEYALAMAINTVLPVLAKLTGTEDEK